MQMFSFDHLKSFLVYLLIFLGICLCGMNQTFAAANHSVGLHLQLPNKLIDIQAGDIEELEVFQMGPNFASIMLRLRPACADRLYKLTAKAIGQSAVWIWNGRVLSMETLQAPIGNDLTVHNFTSFEAEDFKRKESNK